MSTKRCCLLGEALLGASLRLHIHSGGTLQNIFDGSLQHQTSKKKRHLNTAVIKFDCGFDALLKHSLCCHPFLITILLLSLSETLFILCGLHQIIFYCSKKKVLLITRVQNCIFPWLNVWLYWSVKSILNVSAFKPLSMITMGHKERIRTLTVMMKSFFIITMLV